MSQARIFQINLSNGGVPKLPVHTATVTPLGLEGDRQNDLEHHGGPGPAQVSRASDRRHTQMSEFYPFLME